MKVIDKKPVPIYELTCYECKSVIRYRKADVSFTGYLTCPVCGISNYARTICPVGEDDGDA